MILKFNNIERRSKITLVILGLFLWSPLFLKGQKGESKFVNYTAESSYFSKSTGYFRLIGNATLKHKGAVLISDSAHFYSKENIYIAYNNVRMNQGDSIRLTGDKLVYNGPTRIIDVTGDVTFTDGNMTLKTKELIFNRETNQISFPYFGEILNGETKLTSKRGYYQTGYKQFSFKDSVRIDHPDYKIEADTLLYSSPSKTAYFRGPTTLKGDSSFIYCERGSFNMTNDVANFTQNAFIRDGRSFLRGDSIYYERNTGLGELFGNVFIEDTVQHFFITGQLGIYTQKPEHAFITGSPIYSQVLKKDTLHIYGDTIQIDEIKKGRELKISHHVLMYKSDFSGKCDSLYYSDIDSSFTFYKDPILWNYKTQLTSDEMFITTKNQELDSLHMIGNSFMLNDVDSVHYDQVKGRNMFGTFKNNELRTLYVSGNGQTMYYIYDSKQGEYIGGYRADCSNMLIKLSEKKVQTINFMVKPHSIIYPLDKIPIGEQRLKGFKPRFEEKPNSRNDLLP